MKVLGKYEKRKDLSDFGKLVDELRRELGITLVELSRAADISDSHVSNLIHGRKNPTLKTILAFANALGGDEKVEERLRKSAGISPQAAERQVARMRSSQNLRLDMGEDPQAAGIQRVFPNLATLRIQERLAAAKERIRIYETWLADPEEYQASFYKALQARPTLKIQILLLNPFSEIAVRRSKQLNMPSNHFVTDQIQLAILRFEKLQHSAHGKNVEIRIFDAIPCAQVIAWDDHMAIGFFAWAMQSNVGPQALIRDSIQKPKTTLGKFFNEEFNRAWMTSEHLDDWLKKHEEITLTSEPSI